MSSSSILRAVLGLTAVNTLVSGAAIYNSNQKMNEKFDYYWTEAEARFDEQDLTLRAHIGLLEGSLERIEARQRGDKDAESKDGSGIGQNPDYKTSQDKKK